MQYIEGSDETRAKILTEVDAAAIPAANEAVAAAKAQILQAARSMPVGRKEIVSLLCVVADGIALWNEIGAHLVQNPRRCGRRRCAGRPA